MESLAIGEHRKKCAERQIHGGNSPYERHAAWRSDAIHLEHNIIFAEDVFFSW